MGSSGDMTGLRLVLDSFDNVRRRNPRYPKFRLTGDEREDLLADYLPWCETVIVSKPPAVPECRDFSDRPFLELALAGKADALVTGGRPARLGIGVFGSDPHPECHKRSIMQRVSAQDARRRR